MSSNFLLHPLSPPSTQYTIIHSHGIRSDSYFPSPHGTNFNHPHGIWDQKRELLPSFATWHQFLIIEMHFQYTSPSYNVNWFWFWFKFFVFCVTGIFINISLRCGNLHSFVCSILYITHALTLDFFPHCDSNC